MEERGMNERIRKLRKLSLETPAHIDMERAKSMTDTYEKYRITAMVSAEYEAYESMMDAEVYDMALDSLIRTVQRYDKYLQDAETYGCRGEFDKIESAAETALQQDFGLTAEDARTMYALSNKETYSREIYKVLEKAGLSEVTE